MTGNRIAINPLVQKLSKEKSTAGIAGYIGSIEQGKVRVYRDLSFQAYCDISQRKLSNSSKAQRLKIALGLFQNNRDY